MNDDQRVEVRVHEETPLPAEVDLEQTLQCVRSAAANSSRKGRIAANLYLCDAKTVHEMNKQYRSVDSPTDVLSFPQESSMEFAKPAELPHELGDVFICVPLAVEHASAYGHSIMRELAYLAVHGTLHLLGFDHEVESERKKMRAEEERVLAAIPR